jgi:hypothetical protein
MVRTSCHAWELTACGMAAPGQSSWSPPPSERARRGAANILTYYTRGRYQRGRLHGRCFYARARHLPFSYLPPVRNCISSFKLPGQARAPRAASGYSAVGQIRAVDKHPDRQGPVPLLSSMLPSSPVRSQSPVALVRRLLDRDGSMPAHTLRARPFTPLGVGAALRGT